MKTTQYFLAGLLGAAVTVPTVATAASSSSGGVEAMTLYSQGMAVVADSRRLNLKSGAQDIAWPMVSAPAADSLSLDGPGVRLVGFNVDAASNSQGNFQGNSRGDALSARIGQAVTLSDPDGGHSRDGTLVGLSGDTALVQIDDRIVRVPAAAPVLLAWPAGNDASTAAGQGQSPITLHVVADAAGPQTLTLLYQRDAPSWQASYTARFDVGKSPDVGTLKLQANAIIDNDSDTPLDAENAWLVAGQPNRSDGGQRPMLMAMAKSMRAGETTGAGDPQAVGGLYRYPLPGGLHVPARSTRGLALMSPITLDARRQTRFTHYAMEDQGDQRTHASQVLHAENTSGKPLPGGTIRVYAAGTRAQLLGGTSLDDTPAGAPIDLALGEAFDITGTHTVAASANGQKVTITLYNATAKPRPVTIIEKLPPDGQLAKEAPKPDGGNASAPQWQVAVPAQGQKTFTYRYVRTAPSGNS